MQNRKKAKSLEVLRSKEFSENEESLPSSFSGLNSESINSSLSFEDLNIENNNNLQKKGNSKGSVRSFSDINSIDLESEKAENNSMHALEEFHIENVKDLKYFKTKSQECIPSKNIEFNKGIQKKEINKDNPSLENKEDKSKIKRPFEEQNQSSSSEKNSSDQKMRKEEQNEENSKNPINFRKEELKIESEMIYKEKEENGTSSKVLNCLTYCFPCLRKQ